jgi:hypothetical protein
MAHFPHPDGDARAEARQQHAQKAFARWVADFPAVTTPEVPSPEGTVRAYAGGLSATDPKPLPLMCGGIISLKEQWAPVLLQLAEYGLAGAVTEMPGVGEPTALRPGIRASGADHRRAGPYHPGTGLRRAAVAGPHPRPAAGGADPGGARDERAGRDRAALAPRRDRLWTVLSVLRIRGDALGERLAPGEQLRVAERAAAGARTQGAAT